jgi:hypothetical protein
VRCKTKEYRIVPIVQQTLLDAGWEWPEETTEETKSHYGRNVRGSKYGGNKWGGKYLRAPDIYWTILEKGKDKLVRLGDIAKVRRGFTTGANEFFYLDEEKIRKWGVEREFLKPVIKSPKECKRILIYPQDLKFKIFICQKDKKELKGTATIDYIKWGESQGFNKRPTCTGRTRWWELRSRAIPNIIFNYLIDSTARTFCAIKGCYASDNFQEIHHHNNANLGLCASLNSTIFQLMVNMAGRANFGGGLLKIQTYEVSELFCFDPNDITIKDQSLLIAEDWDVLSPSNTRLALDNIIFDALGLTQGESDAVYEAVIHLVEMRLKKADSLKPTA